MPGDFQRETLEMRVLNQNVEIKRLKAEIEQLTEENAKLEDKIQELSTEIWERNQ